MSATVREMQDGLRSIAGHWSAGESVKSVIRRLATELRWPYSRVWSLWYGRARVDPQELDAIRARLAKSRPSAEKQAHDANRELQAQLDRIERQLTELMAKQTGGNAAQGRSARRGMAAAAGAVDRAMAGWDGSERRRGGA